MGGKPATTNEERPREYLYHAYLAFMQYNGFQNPLSVLKFRQAVIAIMKERGHEFAEKKGAVG
ncbi:winged helix-turn-helix domain-containing protein, partial [Escherichia coli]|nr:winged helix-turn-helix domain-containing protein [Escherichia coli]